MAQVAGITIDRTTGGIPMYAHIDLRKHLYLIPILEQSGIEVEEPIKWSAKMKRAFKQAENGEFYVRSREEIMNF